MAQALPLEVVVGQCLQRGKDRAEDSDFSPHRLKTSLWAPPPPATSFLSLDQPIKQAPLFKEEVAVTQKGEATWAVGHVAGHGQPGM